ncbi:MAG: hypothetical protein R2724_26910 [Bryobacterales bacterium]
MNDGIRLAQNSDVGEIRARMARAKKSLVFWIPSTVVVWGLAFFLRAFFKGSPGPVIASLIVALVLFPLAVCLFKIQRIVMGYVALAVRRGTRD